MTSARSAGVMTTEPSETVEHVGQGHRRGQDVHRLAVEQLVVAEEQLAVGRGHQVAHRRSEQRAALRHGIHRVVPGDSLPWR